MYSTVAKSKEYTSGFGLFFKNAEGWPVSPLHDIPLKTGTNFNMIVEIPRWTQAKMEIQPKEALNPIRQDTKKGKLRFVDNCFPYHGYIWNYGALPQTWEDPAHIDGDTKCGGDNDPLDVCEIGYKVQPRGSVVQVKVLGCYALIDEGETDWKIIVIDTTDPLAEKLNDIEDVEKEMPGLLKATYDWFRIYKMPTGKPENKFAFEGRALNRDHALKIVDEMHEQWRKMITGQMDNDQIARLNVTVDASPFKKPTKHAEDVLNAVPDDDAETVVLPQQLNKWHYLKL